MNETQTAAEAHAPRRGAQREQRSGNAGWVEATVALHQRIGVFRHRAARANVGRMARCYHAAKPVPDPLAPLRYWWRG